MLSQGQFFDPADHDPDPGSYDFHQFKAHADYFHGTRHSNEWDPDTHLGGDATHAGTLAAASDRSATFANRQARIFPLKHVGKYAEGWPRRDLSGHYDSESLSTGKTIRYKNAVEDAGSISVVAPASNFQTYRQYVRAQPAPSEKQRLETGRGSREHFHPGDYKPHDWIPGSTSFETHLDEQARDNHEELITNPGPWSKAAYSWNRASFGKLLTHPGDAKYHA